MPKNLSKKKKILLIEDDPFLNQLYVKKFLDEKLDVLSAYDGKKGLELAKRDNPSIIILDIVLPEMDGYEVLDNLKKSVLTASIPVIILTNFFEKEDIRRALKTGAKDYLIKTHCMPSEVVDRVKKILAEG